MPIEQVVPVLDNALLEAYEMPLDVGRAVTSGALLVRKGLFPDPQASALDQPLLDVNIGAGIVRQDGLIWRGFTTTGAVSSRGMRGIVPRIPDFPTIATIASSIPLRVDLSFLTWRETPLQANTWFALVWIWMRGTPPAFLDIGTFAGAEIISRLDVNAGRWTLRYRTADGGGLTDVDLGVTAEGEYHRIGLRWDFAGTRRLAALVDGIERAVVTGAAVPGNTDATGGTFRDVQVNQREDVITGAGHVDLFNAGHLKVSHIGDVRTFV